VKRKAWVAAVLVALAAGGGVVVASSAKPARATAQVSPANTVRVQRGTLAAMVSEPGTLTYRARPDGSPYTVINQAGGTYTELPDPGEKVDCGGVLYRVDERPVRLLCGKVPAYRNLESGDQGKDVRQLNRNLHALGYDAEPADGRFTGKTAAALEKLTGSGELGVDDAVFLPVPVRVAKVTGELGGVAQPGAPVAQATSGTLEVQVNLDASRPGAVQVGDRALIILPGNRSVKGTVQQLGSVAQTAAKDAAATIPASIGLDQPKRARGLDRAPVQVDITTKGVESALSVPVTALVGKAGGGFAVEVVRDGGRRELVAVKLGLFDTANGRVQIDGGVAEGDLVVVPSP
jgi:peptidoglycan hydrolase-like protein with peptidoglycan-binding domain